MKVNKKNHPNWVIFHLVFYGFEVGENGNELVFKKLDAFKHILYILTVRVRGLNFQAGASADNLNNLAKLFLIFHFSILLKIIFWKGWRLFQAQPPKP